MQAKKENRPEQFSIDLENEEWRWIKGYEGLYQISDKGRVKSFKNRIPRILKPYMSNKGYKMFKMVRYGERQKGFTAHRLIAQTFIENPNNKPEVNHIDGDKLNNSISNLEWCTRKENAKHAHENDLYPQGGNVYGRSVARKMAKRS